MSHLDEISHRSIIVDSVPIMISNTMEILIMTINLHYATDNVMIAGLGLSMILIHSLGGSLLLGFNSGYSTYASRAFGANSRTKFNNYIIQGALNLFVLLLLLTVLGMLTYRLCIITGQQADVAYEAYRFYVWQLPGLWCYFIADFLRNQLSAQAIFKPLNYANAFCCIFHVVISSFLSPRYGFYGIVLSTNLTFIFLLVLVILTLQRNSKWPLDKTVYDPQQWNEGYSEFFYQCLYVALPMLLDLFMFEFMALYVGAYQIVEQTAAHIAFSNIVMINGGIISGYACTCMIKAGHLAGMDDPAGLRVLIRRGVLICLGSMEVQYFIVLTFHNYIFDFYTKDERVLERMRGLLFIYFFYCVFDTLMFIGGNLYKAIKYGSWVSKIFVLSYYGVGGIALIILTFTMENKVKVAWLGFMVGSICITVLMWLKSQQIDLVSLTNKLHHQMNQGIEHIDIPLMQKQ